SCGARSTRRNCRSATFEGAQRGEGRAGISATRILLCAVMNTGPPSAMAILAGGAAGFVQSACLGFALLSAPRCAPSVIAVLPAQTTAQDVALQPVSVRVDATTVRLPLAVSGADVAFSDVDRALSRSVRKAIAAPVSKLTLAPGTHLDLQVEIVE